MANIFDTYDDIQVKMALEHAVNTLGALGNVQRDVYKTMVSLESHDGPDIYSQYGLEYISNGSVDKKGNTLYVHAVQQNPAKMSPTNMKVIGELTKRFNINIKVGFGEVVGNKLIRVLTNNLLLGWVNPGFMSKNVLKPEALQVINKTLDSLDRELHKIGWEVVTGGSKENVSHLVGISANNNVISKRQFNGADHKTSSIIAAAIMGYVAKKTTTSFIKWVSPFVAGQFLSGVLLQTIFSGYYSLSTKQLSAFKNRFVYFRDPTLINLSGSNRKYGGILHPTISCLIKTIKPIDNKIDTSRSGNETRSIDYYGVYKFEFGKVTIVKGNSEAVR